MSVRDDLLKQIDAKIKRKKELAKELSQEKTIAHWVSEFFVELDKVQRDDYMAALLVNQLIYRLRKLDKHAFAIYKLTADGEPHVEIRWSQNYADTNNCERILVFDAVSALFQNAIESI